MNEISAEVLQQEVGGALEVAKSIIVDSNEKFLLADANCKGLLNLKKKIQKDFAESKEATYAAWKSVVAQEKGHLDGVDEARAIYINRMGSYRDEQERLRIAEEKRLQAEADKLAQEQQLSEAVLAEQTGDKAQAEEIMSRPVEAAVVILTKAVPKSQTTIRKIPDMAKIEKAVVASGYKLQIPGVEVKQVWTIRVSDSKAVPDIYRRAA